jgi:hypothetical protein
LITLFITTFTFSCQQKSVEGSSVVKIDADLSNFGVESEWCPSIHCLINLANNSSSCKKIYDSPKYKDSTYSLSKNEMQQIDSILKHTDLKKLKNKYSFNVPDQPKSTITFYTNTGKIVIEDYGLQGEYPLQDLYKIIYKL